MKRICTGFENSEAKKQLKAEIEAANERSISSNVSNVSEVELVKKKNANKTSVFTQIMWLLWRNSLGLFREIFALRIQIGQTFVKKKKKLNRNRK